MHRTPIKKVESSAHAPYDASAQGSSAIRRTGFPSGLSWQPQHSRSCHDDRRGLDGALQA